MDDITQSILKAKNKDINESELSLFAWYNPAPVLKLSHELCWITGNPAASELLKDKNGSRESLEEILPFLKDIDSQSLISQGDTLHIEQSIGEQIFQFTIVGLSSHNCLNIYGSDITIRKDLEKKVLHQNKMESVGILSAGVAHELNTPIQFIGDNCEFISDSMTQLFGFFDQISDQIEDKAEYQYLREELPSAIEDSKVGITKISEIVKALKAFTHPGSTARNSINLNSLITNICTISSSEWKYVSTIDFNLDPSIPDIFGMENELGQVLLNLIVNSAHAIDENNQKLGRNMGCIKISTYQQGQYLFVKVKDDGVGIPSKILDKIYNPFFTTKEVGKGTGQGLSFVYAVIQNHGGEIQVDSTVNEQTTFTLKLAIHESA